MAELTHGSTLRLCSVWRALCLVLACVALSGCLTHRALVPVPDDTKADLAKMGLRVGAPMYVRAFKLENVMEVWLENGSGTYTLFRSYPVCNWSGKLGPKLAEGDKQAPEGHYVVNARQMNPNSKYHLSFNIGYPNAFDKFHGRTGRHLMVHGGCSSAGCYAITDDAMTELFVLAREAFKNGQRDFPIAAYPFRLTPEQLARSADHPARDFWINLKEGYDLFERTRRPPVAAVAEGRYVFFADRQSIPVVAQADGSEQPAVELISGW